MSYSSINAFEHFTGWKNLVEHFLYDTFIKRRGVPILTLRPPPLRIYYFTQTLQTNAGIATVVSFLFCGLFYDTDCIETMTDELERIWKSATIPALCPNGMRKTTQSLSHNGRCRQPDWNREPPKYKLQCCRYTALFRSVCIHFLRSSTLQ
jgi:hypothetical protein